MNETAKQAIIHLLLTGTQEEIERAYQLLRAKVGPDAWIPFFYRNSESGRFYKPHHQAEADFVFNDDPKYGLIRGGEGSGKSVAGIIKDLERLRRGMNGIMGSPDLPHFRKSLWPEFKRWCPWQHVSQEQQHRGRAEWEPHEQFTLTFKNKAQVMCGGFENPISWEGPNISWAHFDEARRAKDASMLKVLTGRVRILGKHGEPPQLWLTSTPKKNWLYEYFGPWEKQGIDPYAEFKEKSRDVILLTQDNEVNTYEGYARDRGQSLNEAEKRVLLEASWEDIDDVERFLETIMYWDACQEALPPPGNRTPLILGADAGVSNDWFGLVGVSRHPDAARHEQVAVRYVRKWVPPQGGKLDFTVIEEEIRNLCKTFNVMCLTYDPYQLHHMATRLENDNVVWCSAFNQGPDRELADKQLYDLIVNRQIAHDGNPDLRAAIDNADKKKTSDDRQRIRLVKRAESLKIDLAVACSMAVAKCLELNL